MFESRNTSVPSAPISFRQRFQDAAGNFLFCRVFKNREGYYVVNFLLENLTIGMGRTEKEAVENAEKFLADVQLPAQP